MKEGKSKRGKDEEVNGQGGKEGCLGPQERSVLKVNKSVMSENADTDSVMCDAESSFVIPSCERARSTITRRLSIDNLSSTIT